ncbi:MAG: transglutaminase family protein [Candidatus Thiothrix sulfatifontis]|nr:MAG: transglutaminase family protein [Candidatus Thiothrix sulfatifontis]
MLNNVINVFCKLDYTIINPTSFVFNIAPALTNFQQLHQEALIITPYTSAEWLNVGDYGSRLIRFQSQPGTLTVEYCATVQLMSVLTPAMPLEEIQFSALSAEILPYLNPSRYCESDRLSSFAFKEFGQLPTGYARVQGIADWVYHNIDYIPGSTDALSSACDVLIQRAGVCRDFAHLSIAFCRAIGIPARYVAGYAPELQPPDFHGFFEAYLGGKWYLFDATKLAPVSGFVRIGTGRDAADASFATLVGQATMDSMVVSAVTASGESLIDTGIAVSSATQ